MFVYVHVAPFATVVEIASMASKCVLKRSKKKVKDTVSLNLDEQDGCGSTENQFLPTKRPRSNYSEPVNFKRLMRGEFDKVEHEKIAFINVYTYTCMLK